MPCLQPNKKQDASSNQVDPNPGRRKIRMEIVRLTKENLTRKGLIKELQDKQSKLEAALAMVTKKRQKPIT